MEIKDISFLNIPPLAIENIKKFCNDTEKIMGEEIISVILYGSAVKNNFFPKYSDLNILIVLKNFTIAMLKSSAKTLKRYMTTAHISPWVVSLEDIITSADVYPIKFLDIKKHHILLFGEDIFNSIEIAPSHIRFDIERQIKNIYMNMRNNFINRGYTAVELKDIIISGFAGFILHLSALLHLAGVESPVQKKDIIQKSGETFNEDVSVLYRIIEIMEGDDRPERDKMERVFDEYLDLVIRTAYIVDRFQV